MQTIDDVRENCRFVGKGIEKMVADSVWKLNQATFTDVLNQLCHGNMLTGGMK